MKILRNLDVPYRHFHFMSGHRDALPVDNNDRRFMVYEPGLAQRITATAKAELQKYQLRDLFGTMMHMRGITDKGYIAHLHHLLDTDPMTAAGIFDKKPAMPVMRPIPWQIKVAAMQGRLA